MLVLNLLQRHFHAVGERPALIDEIENGERGDQDRHRLDHGEHDPDCGGGDRSRIGADQLVQPDNLGPDDIGRNDDNAGHFGERLAELDQRAWAEHAA